MPLICRSSPTRRSLGAVASIAALALMQAASVAQPVPQQAVTNAMTLREALQRVLDYNESLQMKQLDVEISRRTYRAERGIYEPQVVGGLDHIDSKRRNNAQQQSSTLGANEFNERNTLYNGGLEFLAPTGARIRTGVNLRDLNNNLQGRSLTGTNSIDGEYEWFVGASLTQPLLKNFGPGATEVRIRLAAIASDLAFQEYRRQMMLMVARTEASYWDLYLTQEQERLTLESLAVAQKILDDNRNRLALGRSSELEVLQAQAGVSVRNSRLNDARLKKSQGASQLTTLFSEPGLRTNFMVVAADQPKVRDQDFTYFDSFQQAFDLNPDFLIRRKQVQQENIRVAYAKNQRLPQLDLKASYGLNGYGLTTTEAWDDVESSDHPAWSIGLEMRIPVTGGIKERNELAAARLGKQKALIGLKEIETQIANTLEASLTRVRSLRDNLRSYIAVVQFHEQLLTNQLDRLTLGRIDSRTVLETEEKLFEARLTVIDTLVQYERALLELELVSGTTLQLRQLDLTKHQLTDTTQRILKNRKGAGALLEEYARAASKGDPRGDMSPDALDQRRAGEVLHDATKTQPPMTYEDELKAREALREKLRQTP